MFFDISITISIEPSLQIFHNGWWSKKNIMEKKTQTKKGMKSQLIKKTLKCLKMLDDSLEWGPTTL